MPWSGARPRKPDADSSSICRPRPCRHLVFPAPLAPAPQWRRVSATCVVPAEPYLWGQPFPSRQSQGTLHAGEPHVALELRAPCGDSAPRPSDAVSPRPWAGRRSGGFSGVCPAGTGQRRHRLSLHNASAPAERVMSPSFRGCWHMPARGKRALASTLPAGSADVGLPRSSMSWPPAPPKGISEPGGLLHLGSGRQQWPTAQQTACQEPACGVPVPSPVPGTMEPILQSQEGVWGRKGIPRAFFFGQPTALKCQSKWSF